MALLKNKPVKKTINGAPTTVYESVVVVQDEYTTYGETYIIVRGVPFSTLNLDSNTTERITIKAMTDVLIVADKPIDEEFNEIELQKGSSVELLSASKWWYIMSSDGLKNS